MNCSRCGAPLKDGARFCTQCGGAAGKERGTFRPLLTAVALAALVLGAALVLFRLGSAPRQDSPKGTLEILMTAFASRDRAAAAGCVDPENGRDLVLDWMEDADGAAQLLYRLAATHDDGSNDPDDVIRLLDGFSELEVVTAVNDWSNSFTNAQSLSVLLRVTPRGGERFTIALTDLDFIYRDGCWYLK